MAKAPQQSQENKGNDQSQAPVTKTRKPRTKIDPNETKSQKFKRLATGRLTGAIENIDNLAALANPTNYEYTPAQVANIQTHLDAAITKMKAAFANPSSKPTAPKVDIG